MSLGFVLLAHTALGRAAQLAGHLAASGFPVAVHVDARVPDGDLTPLRALDAGLPVRWAPRRRRCDWGTWGLVAATRDTAADLLAARPEIRHVCLVSGACLPLRPVRDLADHLARHPDTDFIESIALGAAPWSRGGGDADRFRYRYPVPFHRRALFDGLTDLQRRLQLARALPAGLAPHLGVQWWCLTRSTLEAILADPDRPALERFFRTTWIPDESFFQTMARRHARRLEARSLTLALFDHRGAPRVFYDDHVEMLAASGAFLARKAWPGADRLYRTFLASPVPVRAIRGGDRRRGAALAAHVARTEARRVLGRPGLVMQARCPDAAMDAPRTAAPYGVLWGVCEMLADAPTWLDAATGGTLHGHLFAPGGAAFSGGGAVHAGGLAACPAPRDRDPEAFLRNLVWATRGSGQLFRLGPGDRHAILGFLAGDPNAHLGVVAGAWKVALWQSDRAAPLPDARLLARAARLQAREARALELFRASWVKARVHLWSLDAVRADPDGCLGAMVTGLAPPGRSVPRARLVSLVGFDEFRDRLRDLGLPQAAGPLAPSAPCAGTAAGEPLPPVPAQARLCAAAG